MRIAILFLAFLTASSVADATEPVPGEAPPLPTATPPDKGFPARRPPTATPQDTIAPPAQAQRDPARAQRSATAPLDDPSPSPAPAPGPLAPDLGEGEETVVKWSKTTRRGGIIIHNEATGNTNTIQIGNSGGLPVAAPQSAPRPARSFAVPPDDGPSGPGPALPTSSRVVPLSQATTLELSEPGPLQRLCYALKPRHRVLGTPMGPGAEPIVVQLSPSAQAGAARQPLRSLPVPTAGGKACFGFTR